VTASPELATAFLAMMVLLARDRLVLRTATTGELASLRSCSPQRPTGNTTFLGTLSKLLGACVILVTEDQRVNFRSVHLGPILLMGMVMRRAVTVLAEGSAITHRVYVIVSQGSSVLRVSTKLLLFKYSVA